MAAVQADAMFWILMGISFHRRGETLETEIRRLMELVIDGRGEAATLGLTFTGDRRYGKESIM